MKCSSEFIPCVLYLTLLSATSRAGAALDHSTPTCRYPSPAGRGGVGRVITRQCDRAESSSRLLHRFAHSRYDVLGVRPGSAQELSEQSTLSGNDWSTVDDNVELPAPTLFELDGSSQSVMDEGSETRCLCGDCTSGLAVDDFDVHSVLSLVS